MDSGSEQGSCDSIDLVLLEWGSVSAELSKVKQFLRARIETRERYLAPCLFAKSTGI